MSKNSFFGVACGEKLFKIYFKIIQNLFFFLGRCAQNCKKIGFKILKKSFFYNFLN